MNRFALVALCTVFANASAQDKPAAQAPEPARSTVGLPSELTGLVVNGSEVEAAPASATSKVIVRIDDVQPHGTAHRYALTFTGLEPGTFDLRDYLVRKDRSPLTDAAPIPIEIRSVLPKDAMKPNPLAGMPGPALGGYTKLAWTAGAVWLLGLLAILFVGRKRKRAAIIAERPITLAERLRPLVEEARHGRLPQSQQAELERLLLGVWRRRLSLQALPAAAAIAAMRAHPEAGALLRQLEQWLHAPAAAGTVDVDALLAPYASLPADDPGGGPA